ncbi:MAG TPA: SDR family oxidoreductase [Candidatus Atribacteria bacterium]|nr:SDR family oxidoreductase [Candidatus Atribacteria bacterium]
MLGPIDILVNNAGVTLTDKLEEISEKGWDYNLAVNLKSVFLLPSSYSRDEEAKKWFHYQYYFIGCQNKWN